MRPDAVTYPFAKALTIALALLLATALFRIPSFDHATIEADESLYLIMAQQWLKGGLPYVAIWDHHPIGVPALFVLLQSMLGPDVMVVRLISSIFVWATAVLLYGLVRALGGTGSAAIGASLLYVAYTTFDGGLAANTEIIFIPFVVLGYYFLIEEWRRLETGSIRLGRVLAAGLAFGISLQCKYVVPCEAAAPLAALLWSAWRSGCARGRIVAMVAVFASGSALPTVVAGSYFAAAGHFAEFLQANLLANVSYLRLRAVDSDGLVIGSVKSSLRASLPMTPLIGVILLSLCFRRTTAVRADSALWRWSALWLGAAALDVMLPGKFYNHYFLVLLPPLSILAAVGLQHLSALLLLPRRQGVGFALVLAALLWGPALRLASPALHGLRQLGVAAPYAAAPRDASGVVADYIRGRLDPGASIYVANDEPAIYYLSGAKIATRFAFPVDLTSIYGRDLPVDQLTEIRRIFATAPQYVVRRRTPRVMPPNPALALVDKFLAQDYGLECVYLRASGLIEVYRRGSPPNAGSREPEFCR